MRATKNLQRSTGTSGFQGGRHGPFRTSYIITCLLNLCIATSKTAKHLADPGSYPIWKSKSRLGEDVEYEGGIH